MPTVSALFRAFLVPCMAALALGGGLRAEESAPKPKSTDAAEAKAAAKLKGKEHDAARARVMATDWKDKVVVVPIHGPIINQGDVNIVDEVKAAIKKADDDGAKHLLVDMDSPGGSVEECNQLALAFANAKTPTTALVIHRAISGGAMVSLGCAEIVMCDGARIGDIQPMKYVYDGMQLKYEDMSPSEREKIETDLRTSLRTIAEKRGRPVEVANAMVSRHKQLYRVVYDNGDVEYLDQPNYDQKRQAVERGEDARKIKESPVISREGELLTMTTSEAVAYGIADAVVKDKDTFLAERGWDKDVLVDVPVAEVDMNPKLPDLSDLFADMDIPDWARMVLIVFLVMGIAGLLVEYHMPGFGIPGVCSLIGWVGFFSILMMHDRGSWIGIFLFIVGVALLIVEIAILPGFGVAGIGGIVCILLGLFIAYMPDLDGTGLDWFSIPEGASRSVAWLYARELFLLFLIAGVGSVAVTWAIFVFGKYIPGLSGGVIMTRAVDNAGGRTYAVGSTRDDEARAEAFRQAWIGQTGTAETLLRPAGKVKLDGGERLDVVTDGSLIEVGARVRVASVEDNRVVVIRSDA